MNTFDEIEQDEIDELGAIVGRRRHRRSRRAGRTYMRRRARRMNRPRRRFRGGGTYQSMFTRKRVKKHRPFQTIKLTHPSTPSYRPPRPVMRKRFGLGGMDEGLLGAGNPFDTLGMESDDELGGIFSKIKKAFRKVEKKVNKVRRKVLKATLPKKVSKFIIKTEKNPKIRNAAKIAGAVAAAYFVGPAALTMLKTGAGAVLKSGAGKLVVGAAKSKAAATLLKTGAKFAINQKIQKAGAALNEPLMVKQADINDQNIRTISNDHQFQEVQQRLAAQGYTPEQIAQIWAKSDAYKAATIPAVARTIYPTIKTAYQQAGIPQQYIQPAAQARAMDMAEEAVKQAPSGIDAKTLMMIGVPILAAVVLGG